MKQLHRALVAVLILTVRALAAGDQDLIASAQAIAKRIGKVFDPNKVSITDLPFGKTVWADTYSVSFKSDGSLYSYALLNPELDARGEFRPDDFYRDRATNWIAALSETQSPRSVMATRRSNQTVMVTYSDRPNGYEAYGGNTTTVELLKSGELMSFRCRDGFTYAAPDIKITVADAARVAQSALREHANLLSDHGRAVLDDLAALEGVANLVYCRANSGLGATVPNSDRAGQPLTLKYQFNVGGSYVLVDTKTGHLCGGGIAKGISAPTGPARIEATDAAGAWGLGAGVVACSALTAGLRQLLSRR